MAVNQGRSASPEIHAWQDRTLVVIPRLMKDDYNVFVQEGAIRTERLTEAFLEGLKLGLQLGEAVPVAVYQQQDGEVAAQYGHPAVGNAAAAAHDAA